MTNDRESGRARKRPFLLWENVMTRCEEMAAYRSLAAAIIQQARRDHAWAFFKTEWCDALLDFVGLEINGREALEIIRTGGARNGERKRGCQG